MGLQNPEEYLSLPVKGTVPPSSGARISRLTQGPLMSSCKHFRRCYHCKAASLIVTSFYGEVSGPCASLPILAPELGGTVPLTYLFPAVCMCVIVAISTRIHDSISCLAQVYEVRLYLNLTEFWTPVLLLTAVFRK